MFGKKLLKEKKSKFGYLMIFFGSVMIPIFITIRLVEGDLYAVFELTFFFAAYLTNLVIYSVYFK